MKAQLDQSTKLDSISQKLRELRLDMDYSEDDDKPRILQRLDPVAIMEKYHSDFERLYAYRFELRKQQAILASLNFKARPVRHDAIPEAYARTFHWIFQSDLSRWLEAGSGVFWVNGRAGSGKSTLMKFLADNPVTSRALTNWSKPKEATIVSHYFWNAGTQIQRSQNGLLQSLLYEIFKKCPDCIPIVCSSRWEEASRDLGMASSQPWSMAELSETLTALGSHDSLPTKFCFFVDGLDEFDGDHTDLCSLLIAFSRSTNFKVCVASRPLNSFEQALEGYNRLSIHEFTHNDITTFAEERLTSHPKWGTCGANESDKASLIRDIGNRAHGVFLWVFLVTNSLRNGLTNEDDVEELQQRLDVLPTQLESLFKHMLDSVDTVYHEKQAANFLLALEAREPLEVDLFGYQDNEYRDEDYAIKWPTKTIPEAEMRKSRKRTSRRINARSQGLLEARNGRVEFLHRTVRDFLRTRSINDYLCSKAPQEFNAALSLTKAYLAKIKSSDYSSGGYDSGTGMKLSRPIVRNSIGDNGGLLMIDLEECFAYASTINHDMLKLLYDVLEELEQAVDVMFSTGQAKFFSGSCHPRALVREIAILSGCDEYISFKIDTRKEDYFSVFEESPLFVPAMTPAKGLSMIEFLLDRGLDPNHRTEKIKWRTPWIAFVSRISPWAFQTSNSTTFATALKDRLFNAFLSHGADPNAQQDENDPPAFAIFLFGMFSKEMDLNTATSSGFLFALDCFLSHGADLTAEFCPSETKEKFTANSLTAFIRTHMPETIGTTTLVDAFFCCLEKNYGTMDSARRKLAESAIRMVIHKAKLDSNTQKKLEVLILKSFPSRAASCLTKEFTTRSRLTKRPIDSVLDKTRDSSNKRVF